MLLTPSRVDLHEFASVLKGLGFVNAVNMDGGGSATSILNGTLINYPSDSWYVYVWKCVHLCVTVCVCTHTCMYVCACLLCVCLWECACVCTRTHARVCVLAYSVFVSCVYVCTCVLCSMYTVICVLIPTPHGGSDSPSDNNFQSQQHLELCQTSVHCPLCARGWVLTTPSLLSPWSVHVRALSVPLTMEWRVLWLTHLSWKLQWPRSVPWRWDSVKMALN